jgi:hypothetical protein
VQVAIERVVGSELLEQVRKNPCYPAMGLLGQDSSIEVNVYGQLVKPLTLTIKLPQFILSTQQDATTKRTNLSRSLSLKNLQKCSGPE